jgi:uncharacterized protein
MIIPDVNLLVYAYNTGFAEHHAARQWWEQALNSNEPAIGLAWAVILGFIRVSTSRHVLTRPMRTAEATGIVKSWLTQPVARIVLPGDRHAEILFHLLDHAGVAGNLTSDAHLAALALEYRAEVATADSDFGRFHGLRWFNPLSQKKRR